MNCLGLQETSDFNNPICIESLVKYKAVDVACGGDYMVVIVSSNSDPIKNKRLIEFNDKLTD